MARQSTESPRGQLRPASTTRIFTRMGTTSTNDLSPSDSALLGRMAAGDEGALGLLYDRYGGIAYGLATAMTDGSSVAEAVVAGAFAHIWRGAHTFADERVDVFTWLTTLVRSLALARQSARGRRTATVSASTRAGRSARRGKPAIPTPAPPSTVHRPPSAEVDAVSRKDQLLPAFAGALAALSDIQRRAVELAYFRGLSWREISVELGLPEKSVASQLRSALDTLRPALSLRSASPQSLRIARV
jgi:RNA polymerase sigma-70 factor (ECF subfamily)